MPRDRAWTDAFTLLCERCGYVVEGLATEGACPECGRPIAESLPERRVGTPWQQRRGMRSFVRTGLLTIVRPRRVLDLTRPDAKDGRALARRYAAFGVPLWGVFLLLTWVEANGLRFFGSRRGFRITEDIAWTVCGHGAVGWAIASIGLWIGAGLATAGFGVSMRSYEATDYDPTLASALVGTGLGLGGGLFLIGFLFFETFAWLGLRRLKYANRVRPAADQTTAPEP